MSTWRVAAIVVGCGLVAMWASASAGACVYARGRMAAGSSAPGPREVVDTGGTGLAALQTPSPPILSPQRRNLFRWRDRPRLPAPAQAQARARVRGTSAPADPVDPTPAPPPLTLAGIGESHRDGTVVRTAVISGPGGLWLATEGMVVAGRYRVERIDRDAVVMVDTESGQSRTLRLR